MDETHELKGIYSHCPLKNQKECLRFSANCTHDPKTGYENTSEASVDVEFVFVPRKYGGLFRTNSEKMCPRRTKIQNVGPWVTETRADLDGTYKNPVAICCAKKPNSDLNSIEVCDPNSPNKHPYIYAFEAQTSSLKLLNIGQNTKPAIFIVKIGVPDHYTLATINCYNLSRIKIDYFDSAATTTTTIEYKKTCKACRWNMRFGCILKVDEKATKHDYLNAAICGFFMNRLKKTLNPTTIMFYAVNTTYLQELKRNEFCQTWVLLYIYTRFILDISFESMVKKITTAINNSPLHNYRKDKVISYIFLDLIKNFQRFIIDFPLSGRNDGATRVTLLRSLPAITRGYIYPWMIQGGCECKGCGVWSNECNNEGIGKGDKHINCEEPPEVDYTNFDKRICHMSRNMQILITAVNKGFRIDIVNDPKSFNLIENINTLINKYTQEFTHLLAEPEDEEKEDEEKDSDCANYGFEPEEEDENDD